MDHYIPEDGFILSLRPILTGHRGNIYKYFYVSLQPKISITDPISYIRIYSTGSRDAHEQNNPYEHESIDLIFNDNHLSLPIFQNLNKSLK